MANKVFDCNVWSTNKANFDFNILIIRIGSSIQSLTSINNKLINKNKSLVKNTNFNIDKKFNVFKLIFLIGDLAAKNSNLLYKLLLNNNLEIILFIDDLLANDFNLLFNISQFYYF